MAAKRKRSIEGVLFDWDGTLIDSYHADASAYLAMFDEMGIPWGIEELEKNYSPDWYQVYRSAGLPRGHAGCGRDWAALILLALSPAAIATASPVNYVSSV